MTEITPQPPVDQAERDAHAERGAAKYQEDPLVQIELQGCPNVVPRMMVARSTLDEQRLKIPFGNGYDHFVLDSYITRNGHLVPVFTWIDRTRIAE